MNDDAQDEDVHPDPALLEMLVCPLTKGPLFYDRKQLELISYDAALAFPLRDGNPILAEDDARALSDEEIDSNRLKRR